MLGNACKVGDKVVYTGCCDEQVRWGSNDDPRECLTDGETYTISYVEEHTWHTKISVAGHEGKFNSVSFELVQGESR